MQLSVVVSTLNGREQLGRTLDALTEDAPDAELVVVNGPSSDGTTGMVRERSDVDRLVEISERNVNVARNAGVQSANGDVVAFVQYDLAVEDGWAAGILKSVEAGADVVTGPTHRTVRAGVTTESRETWTVGDREVTFVNGDNGAFTREALEAVDGFDEYLKTGGSRDVSHRVAALDFDVAWNPDVCVRGEFQTDGGHEPSDWRLKYRSLTYRLAKNYGVSPSVAFHPLKTAVFDGASALRQVLGGASTPSAWLENGKRVFEGIAVGTKDGFAARKRMPAASRNPNGVSSRADRVVTRYDL
jgi:glycosyltransferase involved in cell wall biosynthesis